MKNIHIVLTVLLLIAVIILFVLHFSGGSKPSANTAGNKAGNDSVYSGSHDIASINVDSLLKSYKYYDELEKKLLDRQKNMESDLNRKMAAFEKEAAEFQKKVQNNSFLSQESAMKQQEELMEKQQNLYKLREDMTNELMKASADMEMQLLDTVTNFLKQFNTNNEYRYILNSGAFLYGNAGLDITDTVANLLNLRYEAVQAKSQK